MKKTLADLVLSAQAAANKAFAAKNSVEQQTIKIAEFKASGFDSDAAFDTWENAYHAQLEMLTAFSKQAAPAAKPAKPVDAPAAK